jgi:UDP-glucose 4-epimerase
MSDDPQGGAVLVTGATGFIGRKLVEALRSRKMRVYALARDPSTIHALWPQADITGRSGDLGNADSLTNICAGIGTLFHLASGSEDGGDSRQGLVSRPRAASVQSRSKGPAHGSPDENPHWRVTVEGTRRLLEEAVRAGVKRIIYVSSVKAMGEGGESCLDEASPAAPISAYGRAKLEAERLVAEAGRTHGMHVCNLRLPLVYGRDNRGNLWRMIAAVDRGRFPPLPQTDNKRSMVHVDDVVQALQLAAENPAANGQAYIVTDGRVYSTHEIYVAIRAALGRQPPRWTIPIGLFHVAARTGDVIGKLRGRAFMFNSEVLHKLTGTAWYSCRKIETELGYRPTRFLEDGLREMVDEYKRRIAKP